MNKKFICALLTVSMLSGMCIASELNAAELPAVEPPKDVTDNLFQPLPSDLENEIGTWYFNDAKTIYDIGYITGKGGADTGNWKAMDLTTRAEMARILRRRVGVSDDDIKGMGKNVTFNDTKNHWAADDIAWAQEKGIIKGYNNGEYFDPQKPITRAEIAAMFTRTAANPEFNIDLSANSPRVDCFADTANHWAANEIEAARVSGLINSKSTDNYGNALFVPDANTNRAEIAALLTRFGLDPMHYGLSNMQRILPTKDTRPNLQFKAKATVNIDAFNAIILPQLGLDSDKYTVVIPEYQLKLPGDEEYNYMEVDIDPDTGNPKVDKETGKVLYDLSTCVCNSILCTYQYGGAGDGESRLPYIYLAIKNTKTGEMTKYSHYQYKMKKILGADEGYEKLKNINEDEVFKIYFKDLNETLLSNGICQVIDIGTTADMPLGYPYRATLDDGEFEKLQKIFDSLDNNEMSKPMRIHFTLQNLASMSEPVHGSFRLIIEKNNFPGNPILDWEYEG